MKVKVSKWGKCLGIRIPADFARKLGIHEGDDLSIELTSKGLVVSKQDANTSLEGLLAGVTAENRPGEINWGPDVGREIS